MNTIFQVDLQNKQQHRLKYLNGRWQIYNYYNANLFYTIEKLENGTKIINIGYCLEDGRNFKITEEGMKRGYKFDNNVIYVDNVNHYTNEIEIQNDNYDFYNHLKSNQEIMESILLTIKDSNILINTHSNLNLIAGDTIMLMNYMNYLMENNNNITVISTYNIDINILKRNLYYTTYKIINPINKFTNEELIDIIDKNADLYNIIFIRNHNIIELLNNKPYISNIVLYGLYIHLDNIKKINDYKEIITQSKKIKDMYIKNGINGNKIRIIEPLIPKYNLKLPNRTDNEIRLIYIGTLRDNENIIEIIDEFKKIRSERADIVLEIVYGKIHGYGEFMDKIKKIINDGVEGITFLNNLSHKQACYKIATSDIGICWRKDGLNDNGEVSTKMKEYELYGLNIITNNIKYTNIRPCIYFNNRIDFKNIIKILRKNEYYNLDFSDYKIIYLANTGIFKNTSGYTIRTDNILNIVNNKHKTVCFIKPTEQPSHAQIYFNNNNIYIYANNYIKYIDILDDFIKKYNIQIIWSASNYFNGNLSSVLSKKNNIISFYEVRGLWHYTRKYFQGKSFDKNSFNNSEHNEQNACNGNNYVICENQILKDYINKNYKKDYNKIYTLQNSITKYIKPITKKFSKSIVFGYIGSIVSYEGLEYLINATKIIVKEKKINIKVMIIGGGVTNDSKLTQRLLKKMTQEYNIISNIEFFKEVQHKYIKHYYDMIDVLVLPRVDCEVCNLVTPLKPYEAMSFGKILLVSSVNPLTEIIKHEYNGFVFEKNNLYDLVNKMINLLNSKYDLDYILQNSLEFIKNQTWNNNMKNVMSLIDQKI